AGQQIFEEIERSYIQPLHVIEKQRERVFRLGKYADEPSKHDLKTSLRFPRRQFWHWRLLADDELQFRDEIDEELSVRTKRLTKCVSPFAQVFLVLAEEPSDEALKRLGQRGIRNVALVLVGFA